MPYQWSAIIAILYFIPVKGMLMEIYLLYSDNDKKQDPRKL